MIKIETIDHVHILAPSNSEEQAREFYGGILGLAEVEKPSELRPRGGAWFRAGEVLLHIGTEAEPPNAGRRHFAFRVSSVADARAHLEQHGVPTGEAPAVKGMPRFYGFDPFGNQIEFMSYEADI